MSNAYKCDVCGLYSDGKPNIAQFASSNFSEATYTIDICKDCYSRIQILLGEIGLEMHYLDNQWIDYASYD